MAWLKAYIASMRNEVDLHEVSIMQNAEYWTAIIFTAGGRYRGEFNSFESAALQAELTHGARKLIYAVRHPNQALAATCVQDRWELTKLRGVDHPLAEFIKEGKLVL